MPSGSHSLVASPKRAPPVPSSPCCRALWGDRRSQSTQVNQRADIQLPRAPGWKHGLLRGKHPGYSSQLGAQS